MRVCNNSAVVHNISSLPLFGALEALTKGGTCIGLQSAGKGSPPENVKRGQLYIGHVANEMAVLVNMKAVYLLKTLQSFSQGSVAEALHSRN